MHSITVDLSIGGVTRWSPATGGQGLLASDSLPLTKYKVLIQYVGTQYSGWQVQSRRPTIQGALQEALQVLSGENTSVVGAGRTDSGVHALGQVAHFSLQKEFPPESLLRALNGLLPWDIRILRIRVVHPRFHAQKDALKKRYEYRIYNGRELPPFLRGYVYHTPTPLDHEAMSSACPHLCGLRDFSGFAAAAHTVKNPNRRVFLSRLRKKGHHLTYQVEGNGFLHHMVRNIAGTLLQIGTGKRSAEEIISILHSRDRRKAGPTAPAHALYLVRIWY